MSLSNILDALAERTHQVVFCYAPATRQLEYLNPAFEQVWPGAPADCRTNPGTLLAQVHPDDQEYLRETFRQVLRGETVKNVEFRLRLPDGTDRWLCVSPFRLEPPGGQPCIAGFASDITAGKQYNDVLKKFAAKKNSVLEILSHDLAGPLGTIQGLTDMVGKRVRPYNDPELNDFVALIGRMARRNIHLIREFVKQEFLESSSAEVLKLRVDLVAKTREVIEQYQAAGQNISKDFRLEVSADKVYVEIDEVKFMQVINNLISNAIKFTHDDGIITTRIQQEADHVLISVADNGIGIPEHLHASLFDKFTKARRPGLRGEESVGLGMSVIKTIIAWHGGDIWFESRENEGSTFYIRLPDGS
jgi:two-component system sensor histidine kinase VicK